MGSADVLLRIVGVACVVAAAACGSDGGGDQGRDGGEMGVRPPPDDEIFTEVLVNFDSNQDGFINELDDGLPMDGKIDTERRHFFDEAVFERYCVVPDLDSFDDFEKVDTSSGRILVPRGITPFKSDCEADGVETGPLQATLFPSRWCKKTDCSPEGSR